MEQNVVVKWIQQSQTKEVFPDSLTIIYFGPNPDNLNLFEYYPVRIKEMNRGDVYMANRSVTGDWNRGANNKGFNVTNDDIYQQGTKMPKVVPSLTQIPVMSVDNNRDGWIGEIQNGPVWYREAWFYGWLTSLRTQVLDGTKDYTGDPGNVRNDNFNYDFEISNVYPNPATERAEITFELDNPAYATIKLSDNFGREINTVLDKNVPAGSHGLTINTASLPSGAYYIYFKL